VVLSAAAVVYIWFPPEPRRIVFPDGKQFAFSIVDDTDMTTLERVRPIYEVLERYGLRTTKTVWVLETSEGSYDANQGDSLSDPSYREFIDDLESKGFEIALHGVRGGSSRRPEILHGLDEFKKWLGHYPRMQINHSLNKDNIYWGHHLFSFAPYRWAGALAERQEFSGHDPESEYFWGDLARQHIRYVRRFTFADINLLRVNPSFPYKLPDKPYVNYWFPTSNGSVLRDFDELLKSENLDALVEEGGVCLVYAHMGSGTFNRDGGVDPRFEARIKDLASRNGWFAPASEILDFLMKQPGWTGELGFKERLTSETRFVYSRFFKGVN
jgi:hypothetical protein